MSKVEDELKDYGLSLRENDSPEREPVDFSVRDESGNEVASVWGAKSDDVDWECSHPSGYVEYEDDETQGECPLCGSYCDWHYEIDGERNKERVPHEWYPRQRAGGLIGKYLEELEEES